MERELPIEPKALFNLLRMQWLQSPDIEVESWQVEDLRSVATEQLFDRLQIHEVWLDQDSFFAHANEARTPEELTDQLVGDREVEDMEYHQVYLLLFELWRRLLPEKQSLSIFCDELDHLIYEYDSGELDYTLKIQDALADLVTILNEGADDGHDPLEVFEAVATRLANDIESFLYDFINELIDEGDQDYAMELLDGFLPYMSDPKWLQLLKSRALAAREPQEALELVQSLLDEAHAEPDLDFLFELLNLLVEVGTDELFFPLAKELASQLQTEEQLIDLLQISYEYFQRQDRDEMATKLLDIIEQREMIPPEKAVTQDDPCLNDFLSFFQLPR